ncbi:MULTISPECIES: DUF5666 domain-containing protein [Thiorhodovibrio]|uniref:DUF5666 domain-containing protein n=1 Tax=Thiorhodovibrio TaxID=61593 RepID=UPI0019144C8F|nr:MULTISPECIES: DUF5666 domain-containing protein [Thiorhodovibrio]MBK5969364.1 hypothetical protein [Thiorhodovibrio winogradskyi]WPL13354.1 hypothetical protein Thiosp_03155 [Thiorhodovibrio litoralis]
MPKTTLKSLIAATLTTGTLTFGLLGAAGTAQAMNPYAQPDEAWISLSGTVDSVSPDTFKLDYGDGSIFVEMDDGDRDGDAYKLIPGDKVTVTGRIDDDLFESTSIEASSVYLEKLGTTFYSSAADEEDPYITVITPIVIARTTVVGTVENVGDNMFRVNTGQQDVNVMTAGMSYDPLDDEGYQKVETGDRVHVTGKLDKDFFTAPELMAESIVVLKDSSQDQGQQNAKTADTGSGQS